MRVSESVQWIVIYYRTFAQTALTESFELKSETVDLFIVFQGTSIRHPRSVIFICTSSASKGNLAAGSAFIASMTGLPPNRE